MWQELNKNMLKLSAGELIELECIAEDASVDPELRFLAQTVIDAYDEMTIEEIIEEGMKNQVEPTLEQREQFVMRLEEEIAKKYN